MDAIRSSYDAVAERYTAALADELRHKPLERGLLDAFAEIAVGLGGRVADVGCGPGHVTRYLADRGAKPVGIDLSPEMVAIAHKRYPDLDFVADSMTALSAADGSFTGAVALYSIIHLEGADRTRAFAELARVLQPGGVLLLSFHVSTAEQSPGSVAHLEQWFDTAVDLDAHFLDPEAISAALRDAGFEIRARLDREPYPSVEYPSRRTYLLAFRRAAWAAAVVRR